MLKPGLKIFSMMLKDQSAANGRRIEERALYDDNMPKTTCPYPDSRNGHGMNIDALHETAAYKKALLDGLVWINTNYAGGRDIVLPEELSEAACFGVSLPAYCFFRAEKPIEQYGALPVEISVLYKAALGIRTIANYLHEVQPGKALTPEGIFTFSDRQNALVDYPGIACAAPKTMILAALDSLMHGKGGNASDSVLQDYADDISAVGKFAGIMEEFRKYSVAMKISAAEHFVKMEYASHHPFGRALNAMRNICNDYMAHERMYLLDASILQRHANNVLGHEIDAPEPDKNDIDKYIGDNPRMLMRSLGVA
ncbi:MAG: hypothetical protein HY364_03610 [Candidatus Aenigmarchaeota archaeon]|nr:hypothetical protein [Candidatus Aenigmarchaeota archaeon]